MNRLSLLFAALIATSLVLPAPHRPQLEDDTLPAPRNNPRIDRDPDSKLLDPVGVTTKNAEDLIRDFRSRNGGKIDVLFAAVPDPVETHLASAFDHNVAALRDAIADSGYVFDSAWIPWEGTQNYDRLKDAILSASIRDVEHQYPGILLFHRVGGQRLPENVILFLLAEKPTSGISLSQAKSAVELMKYFHYCFKKDIRVIGPTFTGSISSLVALISTLVQPYRQVNKGAIQVTLRSGGLTGDTVASGLASDLKKRLDKVNVDLGSAHHAYDDWITIAEARLNEIGIESKNVAVLTEDESLFGDEIRKQDLAWIPFPRDISALRAIYERQGLLERNSAGNEIRHYLRLSDRDDREGDSVKMFGDEETVAAKESVLLGISAYLRSHHIRAIIIVATSEQDRYFLAQFIHNYSADVRVVIMGATRLFMRGSTGQFRGDMLVSDFPMLARLWDWTSGNYCQLGTRIFPDDYSEGTYMAALDVMTSMRSDALQKGALLIPPEYSAPPWHKMGSTTVHEMAPPMYLSALGSDAAWPVWEEPGRFIDGPTAADSSRQGSNTNSCKCSQLETQGASAPAQSSLAFSFEMPFPFGKYRTQSPVQDGVIPERQSLTTGHLWKVLFWILWALTASFCLAVVYANPVVHRKFAFLQPMNTWRYWLFAVAFPSFWAGASFFVLAWAHRFPDYVLAMGSRQWFQRALWSGAFAASLIAGFCIRKAISTLVTRNSRWIPAEWPRLIGNFGIGCSSSVALLFGAVVVSIFHSNADFSIGEILNIYREMYWESGLSLVPSVLLLLLAGFMWANSAAVGESVLRQTWKLPDIPVETEESRKPAVAANAETKAELNERVSNPRGERIRAVGLPFPTERAGWYWTGLGLILGVLCLLSLSWPELTSITSLETKCWTECVRCVGFVIASCIFLDLLQFAWLWSELRDLLLALDREPLRRSFVPLREFSWNSLWQFSGSSLEDRRNLLADQFEALRRLNKWERTGKLIDLQVQTILEKRNKYSAEITRDSDVNNIPAYLADMTGVYDAYGEAGTILAGEYRKFCSEAKGKRLESAAIVVTCCGDVKDRFKAEELEASQLPEVEQAIERFLCLIYVGFIQTVIVRLRGLAFSFVSQFFLLALSIAIYPFQPLHGLLVCGLFVLGTVAFTSITVYGQMDKDPVLSRLLNSDPSKLERSFYSKVVETLTPPLLPLLSQLLPGGAGRLIDLVGRLFGTNP